MKHLFFLLFLALSTASFSQISAYGKKQPPLNVAPADSIVPFPPASEKRYNDIGKQIQNLQDPDWIAEQIGNLRGVQQIILTTIMETEKRDPTKFQIKELRAGQLIIKPIEPRK